MAFGGVAMGSIKAQLEAMVTGINTFKIGMFKPIAIPATTGANTATNATKPATVETGATVMVPLFVEEGELIRVNTKSGDYVERVKE